MGNRIFSVILIVVAASIAISEKVFVSLAKKSPRVFTHVNPKRTFQEAEDIFAANARRLHSSKTEIFNPIGAIRGVGNNEESKREFSHQLINSDSSTFAVVPKNEHDYHSVFGGESWSEKQSGHMQSAFSSLSKLQNASFDSGSRSIDQLFGVIGNSKNRYLIIIGHNENGSLKLLDGSSVSLSNVADRCETHGAFCIVLSCKSEDHVKISDGTTLFIRSDISFEEASMIAKAMEMTLATNKVDGLQTSVLQLHDTMSKTLRSAEYAAKISSRIEPNILFVSGSGLGGLAILSNQKSN
jgi:hypothetical protein